MGINKKKIMDTIGCDEAFVTKLLEQFVIESKESLDKLNHALAEENWSLVAGSSHKLLSSTRILELNELSNLLKSIEVTAKDQPNADRLNTLVQDLNTKMEETYSELNHA